MKNTIKIWTRCFFKKNSDLYLNYLSLVQHVYLIYTRKSFQNSESIFRFRMLQETERITKADEAFACRHIQLITGIEHFIHNWTLSRHLNRQDFK